MGREGKNWRGLEPGDDLLTTCDTTLRAFVVVPGVFRKFSKIEMSVSIEIIFF